jgi:putative FmdB family regulatory protein
MPFYTFKCPECEDIKEVLQGMNDSPPTCGKCSKMVPRHIVDMKRVFGETGKPQFKGSGFYETDYKKKDKP